MAKKFVPDSQLKKSDAIPLQIGSGEYIYSLGSTDLTLTFGSKVLRLHAVVVDTMAFNAVLGTDFTENESFGGLLTRPPRILIDGEEFSLQSSVGTILEIKRLFRLFKTESYTLVKDVKSKILQELNIPETKICIDVFANHVNFQEELYMTKGNSAFRYNWAKLLHGEADVLWANPPFTQISKVITKLCLEPTRMVVVTPEWNDPYWNSLLD